MSLKNNPSQRFRKIHLILSILWPYPEGFRPSSRLCNKKQGKTHRIKRKKVEERSGWSYLQDFKPWNTLKRLLPFQTVFQLFILQQSFMGVFFTKKDTKKDTVLLFSYVYSKVPKTTLHPRILLASKQLYELWHCISLHSHALRHLWKKWLLPWWKKT